MKSNIVGPAIVCSLVLWFSNATAQTGKWISLFDGKTLNGWKASDDPSSFRVEDGCIVQEGPRAHLFYVGDVGNHDFKNFEFKAQVYTFENANSGIYFHTHWQEKGFPNYGYEVQVNN